MQISAINNSQSFQARIKLNKPKLEVLAQSAIGIAATAAGAATIADGALSANTVFESSAPIEGIPNSLVDSHKSILFEDNNGKGVPVLSTAAPIGFSAGGSYVINTGSNAFRNAIGDDNLKLTAMMPVDASKAVSANNTAMKTIQTAGVLGSVAANLYLAANADPINNALPESIKLDDNSLEASQLLSISAAGSGIGVPSVLGTVNLSDKISKTKSSQFISDTLTDPESTKKIPS